MNATDNQKSFWAEILSKLHSNPVYQWIKGRTRKEWIEYFQDAADSIYQKLTSSTEKALFVGFIAGIITVLFFKLVLFLLALILIFCSTIWVLADSSRIVHPGESDDSGNSIELNNLATESDKSEN